MTETAYEMNGAQLPVYVLDTLIIGTGCAGYNAADWLHGLGRRDIAILTENKYSGASRNTGSDKQTYYKFSFAGDVPDSISMMANDLFARGGMHGDHALAQAACSARCFFKLAGLGVPFPTNAFGEYVGYRTDHDNTARATSAGPLTSRYMTERLERSVMSKCVRVFDNMLAARYLVHDNNLLGVLALDLTRLESVSYGLTLFCVNNVIMATGGPAGVYHRVVYPPSQTGMTGMALAAGAAAENIMLWQYGLASTKFRWNVSGAYQQVIPRYVSLDHNGHEREMSIEHDLIFRKGYEWPYDPAKRSSQIDQLVYREIHEKGNRVFLDYRSDPVGFSFGKLSGEARGYLKRSGVSRSGALLETPIARLERMNPQAIALYLDNGIDLRREMLEIDVCAQHCNGGVAVDAHWQSSVRGLYAAGEAAGTFGAYRPGGSALNAGQVGSMRAAEHIARKAVAEPDLAAFSAIAGEEAREAAANIKSAFEGGEPVEEIKTRLQKEFSAHCAFVREPEKLDEMLRERRALLASFFERSGIARPEELPALLRTRDILTTQAAMLSAMIQYDRCDGNFVAQTQLQDGEFISAPAPVRPIPVRDTWFETVWNNFREGDIV